MLIVEGLDNTGKTTLVQWISEEYPQFEVQQSIGNNHDLRMIRLQAHDESSLNRPLLLCDRSRLISEYVYNPVLKSRPIAYDLRDWLNMIGGFLTDRKSVV